MVFKNKTEFLFLFLILTAVAFGFLSCAQNNSPAGAYVTPPGPPSNYITQWGSYGSGNGQFFQPSGIAVNSAG